MRGSFKAIEIQKSYFEERFKVYQEYVFKDGSIIGRFDDLYNDFDDPWNQSATEHIFDTRRNIAIEWCKKLRDSDLYEGSNSRVIELGSGFGHLTERLRKLDFSSLGIDKVETAITKARNNYPDSIFVNKNFKDFEYLKVYQPDIIIMAELTWYVLDSLPDFIAELNSYARSRVNPVYLIHLLTTYAPGVQKYGLEYFSSLQEILDFFKMDFLESGIIYSPKSSDANSQGTFFVARVSG